MRDIIIQIKETIARKNICLVGIDGGGGSGKSTLASYLCEVIGDGQLIHMDDFYHLKIHRGPDGNYDLNRLKFQVLTPLLENKTTSYQRYDWTLDCLSESYEVLPHGLVVIEGCYSLCQQLGRPYDVMIFVKTCDALRLERGLIRDGEESRPLWDEWMQAEAEYFKAQQPDDVADFIISGENPYAFKEE